MYFVRNFRRYKNLLYGIKQFESLSVFLLCVTQHSKCVYIVNVCLCLHVSLYVGVCLCHCVYVCHCVCAFVCLCMCLLVCVCACVCHYSYCSLCVHLRVYMCMHAHMVCMNKCVYKYQGRSRGSYGLKISFLVISMPPNRLYSTHPLETPLWLCSCTLVFTCTVGPQLSKHLCTT